MDLDRQSQAVGKRSFFKVRFLLLFRILLNYPFAMKFRLKFHVILCLIALISCRGEPDELPTGSWHAELEVMDGKKLAFNFELLGDEQDYKMKVNNAEEVVEINDIEVWQDSILIRMPVYEGYIKGKWNQKSIRGSFIKESLDRVVPFHASWGDKPRYRSDEDAVFDVTGVWQAEFSANTPDAYQAKGIFNQSDDGRVTGTFLTEKGDYRFLEGVMNGDQLILSAFDGAHAFLFTAQIRDSVMKGQFYSGNHFKEPFTAEMNPDFELRDADQLTYLKEGYESLSFSFPDPNGQMVSLTDPEFTDKVIVVQIMGTWCPNCMDETRFFAEYLRENNSPDLRFIALAFEYARTQEEAFKGIRRLKEKTGIKYPVLLAQFGTSNKIKANEKLPMLNHVLSYPTTIFIDKKGQVRRIHTGFNGPATGEKYTEFKQEFDQQIQLLLSE